MAPHEFILVDPMAEQNDAGPIPEGLRRLYYMVGQDQAEARSVQRRATANCIARSMETLARSRDLLDRLHREAGAREASTPPCPTSGPARRDDSLVEQFDAKPIGNPSARPV
jgi:hypothetical protein